MDRLLDALNELQNTTLEANKLVVAAKGYAANSANYDEHIRWLVIQGLAGLSKKSTRGASGRSK